MESVEPATFPVSGVIVGWTEAVQRTSPGARFQLAIRQPLGCGENGYGDAVRRAVVRVPVKRLSSPAKARSTFLQRRLRC